MGKKLRNSEKQESGAPKWNFQNVECKWFANYRGQRVQFLLIEPNLD